MVVQDSGEFIYIPFDDAETEQRCAMTVRKIVIVRMRMRACGLLLYLYYGKGPT